MRNHEVTDRQPLLNGLGELAEPGWARTTIWDYNRRTVKVPKFRIKEWDYYLVMAQDFAVALTISDDGYMGLQSVSFLDFINTTEHTKTILNALPLGKLHMPGSPTTGDCHYQDRHIKLDFIKQAEGRRKITCEWKKFDGEKDFSCDVILEETNKENLAITLPWKEDKKAFYYNQKINCMRASGEVCYNDRIYTYHPETDYATLDWGRGVWTYDNTWLWSNCNGTVNGKAFGFNLGYGFGDNSAATENVFYYDGELEKLDDVEFIIPKDSYLNDWKFQSSDGRVDLTMHPILDRSANMDALIIKSEQHQVFGKLRGKIITKIGKTIFLDNIMFFAEKVHNQY